jgi:hypothetical protein
MLISASSAITGLPQGNHMVTDEPFALITPSPRDGGNASTQNFGGHSKEGWPQFAFPKRWSCSTTGR